MIAIPNDRLLALVPRGTSFFEAFKVADDLLRQAVQGISDIIITPGLINRDFSDIKATMVGHGLRHDGHGHGPRRKGRGGSGARRPSVARCWKIPRIAGSRGILINITGSSRLGLHEVNEACSHHSRSRRLRRRADQFRRDPERIHGRRREDHGDRHRIPAGELPARSQ